MEKEENTEMKLKLYNEIRDVLIDMFKQTRREIRVMNGEDEEGGPNTTGPNTARKSATGKNKLIKGEDQGEFKIEESDDIIDNLFLFIQKKSTILEEWKKARFFKT